MLYGFLVSLFVFNAFLLILLIMIQQGKGNMGLGNLGGATQMIFGGSGGQDILQKITWVLGSIFMIGSLGLALMRASSFAPSMFSRILPQDAIAQEQSSPVAQEELPAE